MLLITAKPIRNLRTPASTDMNKRGFSEQASPLPLPNPPPLFSFLPIPYPLPLSTPASQARVNILSFLLDSYVTHVLHTPRISNDASHCMYNDMKPLIKTLLRLLTVLSMLFVQTSSQHQVPNISLLPQLDLIFSNDGIQRAS